jgi:hypothetical protein
MAASRTPVHERHPDAQLKHAFARFSPPRSCNQLSANAAIIPRLVSALFHRSNFDGERIIRALRRHVHNYAPNAGFREEFITFDEFSKADFPYLGCALFLPARRRQKKSMPVKCSVIPDALQHESVAAQIRDQ